MKTKTKIIINNWLRLPSQLKRLYWFYKRKDKGDLCVTWKWNTKGCHFLGILVCVEELFYDDWRTKNEVVYANLLLIL